MIINNKFIFNVCFIYSTMKSYIINNNEIKINLFI